jgi:hypothetical protein
MRSEAFVREDACPSDHAYRSCDDATSGCEIPRRASASLPMTSPLSHWNSTLGFLLLIMILLLIVLPCHG